METSEKTVSVGTQLSMMKPAHKSHSTQTKYQVKDQIVQVGTSVRMNDIAVSCNFLHAPPVPAQSSSFKPTLYSDDTITDDAEEDDDDDGEYSMAINILGSFLCMKQNFWTCLVVVRHVPAQLSGRLTTAGGRSLQSSRNVVSVDIGEHE